jgi:8-oxo-dGTP pyrophosphatase MutT (NUDIX family)
MIALALSEWKETPRPRFNVLFEPFVWEEQRSWPRSFEQSVLAALEAARQQCKNLRRQPPLELCPVLWLARDLQKGFWHYGKEPEFGRTSTAAFALIRRCLRREIQFLLCWNPKHRGFNFPGGHLEIQDADNPRLTMQRELHEELGLTVAEAEGQAVFNGPLRAVRPSRPNDPLTAYAHYFDLLDGQRMKPSPSAVAQWEWASLEEMQRGSTNRGKPIRRFPFELLRPIIASLSESRLPLSATEHSDCVWETVRTSIQAR